MEECNEFMLEAMRKHPGRLKGYCYVLALDAQAVKKEWRSAWTRDSRSEGAGAARFDYTDPGYAPAFAIASERRVPVLLHTYGDSAGWQTRFRDWRISIRGEVRAGARRRAEGGGAHTDCERARERVAGNLHQHVHLRGGGDAGGERRAGEDRVGSGRHTAEYAAPAGKVLGAQIPESAKKKILSENAKNLLGAAK